MKDHTFTLGIEEEFAIVDPKTRELRSHIQEILEGGKVMLKEQIKPEMHQSVVELGTEICQSIVDARAHVADLRSKLAELAGRGGLKIASAARACSALGVLIWVSSSVTSTELAPRESSATAPGVAEVRISALSGTVIGARPWEKVRKRRS